MAAPATEPAAMDLLPAFQSALSAATLALFALVALVAIATPGPTVLLALTNGSRFGVRRSLPGMLGAVVSDFVLVGAVALGLGALLAASEFWFSVLKWVGAAYLAWIGWKMLRSNGALQVPEPGMADAEAAPRRVFAKSFLVAVTNPKGYLFCSALLPQFIDPAAGSVLTQSIMLGFAQIAVSFSGNTAIVVGAGSIAAFLATRPTWLKLQRWLMGTVLAGLALRMARRAAAAGNGASRQPAAERQA